MFEAPSPFDIEDAPAARLLPVRVTGGVRVRIAARGGRSYAADVLERDGYKVRFPRGAEQLEAIIINTGGGLAGGDRVSQEVDIGDGAEATVATQASERVYRALGEAAAMLDVRLSVGAQARLNWLPQDTIIFDRARLRRSIEADMTGSSRLLIAETVVFGRTAMGETVRQGQFLDCWRIRVDGKLVFAETARLEGEIAEALSMPAIAGGAHVVSTVLAIREDAEDLLEPVRAALAGEACEIGASAWGRVLVVRSLGRSSESVRLTLGRVIPILSGAPLPRVWQT